MTILDWLFGSIILALEVAILYRSCKYSRSWLLCKILIWILKQQCVLVRIYWLGFELITNLNLLLYSMLNRGLSILRYLIENWPSLFAISMWKSICLTNSRCRRLYYLYTLFLFLKLELLQWWVSLLNKNGLRLDWNDWIRLFLVFRFSLARDNDLQKLIHLFFCLQLLSNKPTMTIKHAGGWSYLYKADRNLVVIMHISQLILSIIQVLREIQVRMPELSVWNFGYILGVDSSF